LRLDDIDADPQILERVGEFILRARLAFARSAPESGSLVRYTVVIAQAGLFKSKLKEMNSARMVAI